jgi:hypothetical protein
MATEYTGNKSSLDTGYVFAPYIPMTTSANIVEYGSKKISRKRKINKIFDLGLSIDDEFSRTMSKYSKKTIIANYYKTIKITQ